MKESRRRASSRSVRTRVHALAPSRRRVARHTDAGDTLLEILITLVIISLALVALMGAFTTTINASADYRNAANLNTVLVDTSQSAIAQLQQQSRPLFTPCATAATYNAQLNLTAPTGYSVTVTQVDDFVNGRFVDVTSITCNPNSPTSTAPQEIFLTAYRNGSIASAPIAFVIDDRGGTPVVALPPSVITVYSTPPATGYVSGTYDISTPQVPSATSGDAVIITSENPSVCSVSGYLVTFDTPGTCAIDYNDPGNTTYGPAATVTQSFAVIAQNANAINFTTNPPNPGYVNTTYNPGASATDGNNVNATLGSGDAGVCTVNNFSGVVTFTGVGTCTLNYNDPGNASYVAATQVTQTITVTKRANSISYGTNPPNPGYVGSTYNPGASATDGNNVIATVGSGPCSVNNATGVVTFNGVGTCVLNYNDAGNSSYFSASSSQSITTTKHANSINYANNPPNPGYPGSTYNPGASATDGNNVNATLGSGDAGVCTVNNITGVVTFTGVGTCSLNFVDPGNATYFSTSATQQITVAKLANSISISNAPPNPAGRNGTYDPGASATDGNTVIATLGSGDFGVCTVNNGTGVVTFTGAGTCTLNYNDAGNASYAAATQVTQTITVSNKRDNTITLGNQPGNPQSRFSSYRPNATATDGNNVNPTVVSGPCTVSFFGRVTFTGAGTCTLNYSDPGNFAYVPANLTQSFTVQ